MNKRVSALLILVLAVATIARADQITFSAIGVGAATTSAVSGFNAGPGLNVSVTDATTGVTFTLSGLATVSTGPASSFLVTTSPDIVVAVYTPGITDSILITDPSKTIVYLSGVMEDNSAMLATYPDATGSFHGRFDVTSVNPAVLAMFGLGPQFDPRGSVGVSFGSTDLGRGNTELTGVLGGASYTIVSSAVPEPTTLSLAGSGLLLMAVLIRRRVGVA